jgi:hypothetical protein
LRRYCFFAALFFDADLFDDDFFEEDFVLGFFAGARSPLSPCPGFETVFAFRF